MSNTPLEQIIDVERDAREYGFEWPNTEMIIDQAISECEEIRSAIKNGEGTQRIHEEIGDLLHTAISLCIFAGYDTEETLSKASAKFDVRMQALKKIALERGLTNLKNQNINFMLELWKLAKEATNEHAY